MGKRAADKILSFFGRIHKSPFKFRAAQIGIFLLVISPIAALAIFSYAHILKNLTETTVARRETVAELAAATLSQRFERLTDLGISFATRVQFRILIEEERWGEAIKILERVPKDFPDIERVFLTDPSGILHADTPALPDVVGKNFSFRDWYTGVISTGKPYVSEVYKRTAEPQYNVIAVAVPIKTDSEKLLGILVMQIKLDAILSWTRNINIGSSGFVYVVDQNGQVAAHPKFSPQDAIVDFSGIPSVQKVLRQQQGIEEFSNPIENEDRLVAFVPVKGYGWGVLAVEDIQSAFASRTKSLRTIFAVYALILIINSCLMYLIFGIAHIIFNYRQTEKIFLESIGDGVIAIDRSWKIILWNRAATEITGWKEEDAVGKPLREVVKFIREQDRKENITFIEEAILFGETRTMENNTVFIRKDGTEIPMGDSAAPIFDESGEVTGAIITFRNTSVERDAHRLRSDFAYASHQLRTPVTQALWSLESALSKKQTLATIRAGTQIAFNSMKSVERLVEQLLETSSIDQKQVIAKSSSVKLVSILDELLKNLEKQAKDKGVSLRIAPVSQIWGIETDEKLFKRILTEIIENAIDYNHPDGWIEIVAIPQTENILLEVRDSGIGIPLNQQTSIFTKFFRGSNFDTNKIHGAGLGLFIAQAYTNILGGKIWFKSEENKGTAFSILLPISYTE